MAPTLSNDNYYYCRLKGKETTLGAADCKGIAVKRRYDVHEEKAAPFVATKA